MDRISGSVFAFDVAEIIKTIEQPNDYDIDSKGFNASGYPQILDNPSLLDLFSMPRPANSIDLTRYSIDDINPLVDWRNENVLYKDLNGDRDYKPNRVMTLTWNLVDNITNLGQWRLTVDLQSHRLD